MFQKHHYIIPFMSNGHYFMNIRDEHGNELKTLCTDTEMFQIGEWYQQWLSCKHFQVNTALNSSHGSTTLTQ
jgi:hypothetical protein